MVSHRAKNKTNAKKLATKMRRKGFASSVFKKKKGYGISVTRK